MLMTERKLRMKIEEEKEKADRERMLLERIGRLEHKVSVLECRWSDDHGKKVCDP